MMQTIVRPTTKTASAPVLLTVKLAPMSPAVRQGISLSGNATVRVTLAA